MARLGHRRAEYGLCFGVLKKIETTLMMTSAQVVETSDTNTNS